jgi:hypothetical protein
MRRAGGAAVGLPLNRCAAGRSRRYGHHYERNLHPARGPLLYLPYAIFCIASPVLSVIYGVIGFKIKRIEPAKEEVG